MNEEGFGRPVESIMRCEDFKSNFARRLSNRYIARSPICGIKQEEKTNVPQVDVTVSAEIPENGTDGNVQCVVKDINEAVQCNQTPKLPDKLPTTKPDIRGAEVAALNIEVETLRWQLAQTEANRQMNIALLKQIVTFLNRIKDHMDVQDMPKKPTSPSKILPRSHSVLHVNKNVEYTIPNLKKLNSRKISQSISNVNGLKECNRWRNSKISLESEKNTGHKLCEEIKRLINLTNTVLSTKLPELVSASTESVNTKDTAVTIASDNIDNKEKQNFNEKKDSLSLIEEDCASNMFTLNSMCDSDIFDGLTNKYIETMDRGNLQKILLTSSPLTCGLENDLAAINLTKTSSVEKQDVKTAKTMLEKRYDNNTSYFIEDESGFSSMSSFQEIGIPIINVIPPTPCKEICCPTESKGINHSDGKWKNVQALDGDKQTMKVFWV